MLKRISCIAIAMGSGQWAAAWTAVNLNPAPSLHSIGYGGKSGTQAGYILAPNKFKHATYWNFQNGWTDLHPAGFEWSEGHDSEGENVVGYALSETTGHHEAILWFGSASNYVNLNPNGYHSSHGRSIRNGEQAGAAILQGGSFFRAMIWHGSAGSAVDLHPSPNYTESILYGTDGSEQVGTYSDGNSHAGMWHGSAASFIDLSPSWAQNSTARDTSGGVQVGFANVAGDWDHAVKWFGTAASAMEIHPAGALASWAYGVHNNVVVGTYLIAGQENHAVVFGYRRIPHTDLHNFLPPGYSSSEARAIDENGNIIGFAVKPSGETHAFAWIP